MPVRTHGLSKTKEYRAWTDAKRRCYNPEHSEYCRYGAIGITMSDEFVDNPVAFVEYMGKAPKGYSLDRIDPNKGYERGNLRWTDDATQTRNQKKQQNNTSGHTGVTRHYNIKGTEYWMARWHRLDGKVGTKTYTISKYGEELAFFLACEKRDLEIMKLNLLGANYSEHHGK